MFSTKYFVSAMLTVILFVNLTPYAPQGAFWFMVYKAKYMVSEMTGKE
jgi:hypothetical protein